MRWKDLGNPFFIERGPRSGKATRHVTGPGDREAVRLLAVGCGSASPARFTRLSSRLLLAPCMFLPRCVRARLPSAPGCSQGGA